MPYSREGNKVQINYWIDTQTANLTLKLWRHFRNRRRYFASGSVATCNVIGSEKVCDVDILPPEWYKWPIDHDELDVFMNGAIITTAWQTPDCSQLYYSRQDSLTQQDAFTNSPYMGFTLSPCGGDVHVQFSTTFLATSPRLQPRFRHDQLLFRRHPVRQVAWGMSLLWRNFQHGPGTSKGVAGFVCSLRWRVWTYQPKCIRVRVRHMSSTWLSEVHDPNCGIRTNSSR